MKDTKTEFKFFTIPQWRSEERYLREQHNKGWEFVCVNGLGWYHFQKCEPEDVIYQLDYNSDSVSRKKEYVQIFSDCGWEYLQNYAGYSYFRKPISQIGGMEEGIFSDDASRLDMMKRVFAGRMIPVLVIFFAMLIPQLILYSNMHTPIGYGLSILISVLLLLYFVLFVAFAIPFWDFYKSMHKK